MDLISKDEKIVLMTNEIERLLFLNEDLEENTKELGLKISEYHNVSQ